MMSLQKKRETRHGWSLPIVNPVNQQENEPLTQSGQGQEAPWHVHLGTILGRVSAGARTAATECLRAAGLGESRGIFEGKSVGIVIRAIPTDLPRDFLGTRPDPPSGG